MKNLRYYALGAYVGLIALWTGLDKIPLNEQTGLAILAPIAAIITADIVKHRKDV